MKKTAPLVQDPSVACASLHVPCPVYSRLDVAYVAFALSTAWGVYSAFPERLLLLGGVGAGLVVALILLELSCFWSVQVRVRVAYSRPLASVHTASVVLVVPIAHHGSPAFCPIQTEEGRPFIMFQKHKYLWDADQGRFLPLKFPVDLRVSEYLQSEGVISEEELQGKLRKYGPNAFDIPLPTFSELFIEHAMAPFFVFQVLCVLLWCLDEYVIYSLMTLGMLVLFERMVVGRRLAHLQNLRKMRVPPHELRVYRSKKWQAVQSDQLVPGDLVALSRHADDVVVSCDILLLGGTVVVNEALLTGESKPQLKEAVDLRQNGDQEVNIDEAHKPHVVWGGTKIVMQTPPSAEASGELAIKSNPPKGCALGYVLRTGFETSQGQLVRTILFSTERMSANSRETLLFMLFLLCFAVTASGYVLYHGLQDDSRSRFKLLLNCVMIITSVIPPELPMELTLAVTTSLAALVKNKIYCTEPFRVPLGGAVDVCCFDKTGTLTSDNFFFLGVAVEKSEDQEEPQEDSDSGEGGVLIKKASLVSRATQIVIGACHSLVLMPDSTIIGDPLEKVAFDAVRWRFHRGTDSMSSHDSKTKARIEHRFSFSSALKRMSCLVVVEFKSSSASETWLVSKGAPEVMKERFVDKPANYDAMHRFYSRQGCRILALGYRQFPGASAQDRAALARTSDRDEIETQLVFAGFLVLQCPIKSQSYPAIKELVNSSHRCVMITGDHTLTASHVARSLGIASRPVLVLSTPHSHVLDVHRRADDVGNGGSGGSSDDDEDGDGGGTGGTGGTGGSRGAGGAGAVFWESVDEQIKIPFCMEGAAALCKEYSLCVSGMAMSYFLDVQKMSKHRLGDLLMLVSVFARTSPKQKELIVTQMKDHKLNVLMCGDGTNDVGALKQAHVGVALLINPMADKEEVRKAEAQNLEEDNAEAEAEAEAAASASAAASATSAPSSDRLLDRFQKIQKQHGRLPSSSSSAGSGKKSSGGGSSKSRSKKDFRAEMERLRAEMEAEEPKAVQLGDASIASPFTSKVSDISSIVHIIRQGRCTLVTTMQVYHVLALNCLIQAYSLSVLYLDGIKFGDTQLTIQGMAIAAFFLFVSMSKPVKELSRERPASKLFTPWMFITILGQFAIHLYALVLAVAWSKEHTPAEDMKDPDGDFKPNVLNTVIFILSTTMTVATFLANYRGRPFMAGLRENKMLWKSLMAADLLMMVLVLEIVPSLNAYLELHTMPSPQFRSQITVLVLVDTLAAVGLSYFVRWASAIRPPKMYFEQKGVVVNDE